MRRLRQEGFTLVELLVVIAIITILMFLLIPAVNTAREAARRAHCKNNLKQMGIGAIQHRERHGFYPTGGWGWRWAGEPERGFTSRQPGGWHYNLLPFIDLTNLHQMGAGGKMRTEGRQRVETVVPLFHCPSRRRAVTYPYVHGSPFFNVDRPSYIGRSDYAACGGDRTVLIDPSSGPSSLTAWTGNEVDHSLFTGITYVQSMVRQAHIPDGTSHTYLYGERYISVSDYETGVSCANDQGWDIGYDYDVGRWTRPVAADAPAQDRPGWRMGCETSFGAAHSAGFQMVFADGSVHSLSYKIDTETHRRLGARNDGNPVDFTRF